MFKPLILLTTIALLTICLPEKDKVTVAPGFNNTIIYSGYLATALPNRRIHYVFIAAQEKPQSAPLTIWFNGGPGCSSLIGMFQEIGPYLVGNNYKEGDSLKKNDYAWNRISNLLFLQSPAIVGFSSDTDHSFRYTDQQTANDAFQAIKDFLFTKAVQFETRDLYLSGESYAGKYVPDIAERIVKNNEQTSNKKINLKGLLIGNGVMSFQNNGLTISQIEFLAEKDFLSPRLVEIANQACRVDFQSPRCKYLQYQFHKTRATLNVYNVFQVCQEGKEIQALQLSTVLQAQSFSSQPSYLDFLNKQLKQINGCPSDNGTISYLNLYKSNYNVQSVNKTWSPCAHINYEITQKGSMDQYYQLFKRGVKVWLFSGDWDDQVPFPDTERNLAKLGKRIHEKWDPWFIHQNQHSGFFYNQGAQGQTFSLITVKTASHMVPQSRPKEAYQMFYNFINGKSVNTTIPWW